jgi:hypothetical protein
MEQAMKHEQALVADCPQCGVGAGEPCEPASGDYTYEPHFYTHTARKRAAAGGVKARPIIFDGNHNGPKISDRHNTKSRHHVVIDAHAGKKIVEMVLDASVLPLLIEFCGLALASGDPYIVFVARDAVNAPRRFVMQTGIDNSNN